MQGTEPRVYALHILSRLSSAGFFRLITHSPISMYRFSIALLAVFMLAFSACVDTGEPEALDEADDADIIPDDDYDDVVPVGYYDTWDTDADTRLSADEFGTGVGTGTWWSTWDADGDGYLSEDEYNTVYANETWYGSTAYSDWDMDGDNLLSEDEWSTGLFNTWDANDDTYLTADEYDEGLFDM